MNSPPPSRDDLAALYLDQLPFEPYPVQEEALLAWFTHEEGVLVCAPTGTGKTAIAEAALFEALHTRQRAYYTTPLIALTEQKFAEMQDAAERWGFSRDDIGLVTGNRRVNAEATVLVVVAEILLNRLLHPAAFDFSDTHAVVMDEFHSFNDRERGIVWEFSLALLPPHVRLLLLSATVGNAYPFVSWLRNAHGRTVELVSGGDRAVPLHFHWVGDKLLNEHIEEMASGDLGRRTTPALIFCFNRDECWNVAEQLKGKSLLVDGQQKDLAAELEKHDWSTGAGPKLKQILMRGVGVHHAGLMPKHRRLVEDLFQRRLLSVAVCTETLAAGINLPARSVVLPNLLKGPPGDKKLIEPSAAHQIFGRAGRPQYDSEGHVFALAHEDDVKILRWREKFESLGDNPKDPGLRKAQKALKKKQPSRRSNQQYWNEQQFQKLHEAGPGKLGSRGQLPWRLLAYMLELSPEVEPVRAIVRKRLMPAKKLIEAEQQLDRMLLTLHRAGYVRLEPPPEAPTQQDALDEAPDASTPDAGSPSPDKPAQQELRPSAGEPAQPAAPKTDGGFGAGLFTEALEQATQEAPGVEAPTTEPGPPSPDSHDTADALAEPVAHREAEPVAKPAAAGTASSRSPAKPAQRELRPVGDTPGDAPPESYRPRLAHATPALEKLLLLRSVNPLYGMFLVNQLQIADRAERIQAIESVLEMAGSVARLVRVPKPDYLPPGPLATERLNGQLLKLGLVTEEQITGSQPDEDDYFGHQDRVYALTLADKLKILFDHEHPGVFGVRVTPVWAAGELLEFGCDFDKYISARGLAKQEGILFRHFLRMILLCGELASVEPSVEPNPSWQSDLKEIADGLSAACHQVDPTSTDKMLEAMKAADVVEGEGGAGS